MPAVDYQPLSQPLPVSQIKPFLLAELKAAWLGCLIFIVMLWLAMGIIASGSPLPGWLFGLASMIAPLAIGMYIWRQARNRVRLQRLAAANGWQFVADQAPQGQPGMIFDFGRSRKVSRAFIMPGDQLQQVGNYQCTTGSGKNSRTHRFGYLRIKLPRRLPHMVLDARANNFLNISNLPEYFSRDQRLSLEGDFDQHFTLYAPRQYATDALYVFTPDVMQAVIDHGKGFDMEVIDDSLYIYASRWFKLDKPTELDQLFTLSAAITKQIHDQADYYADSRVGDRSLDQVADGGRRLKQATAWPIIIFAIVYALFMFLT